MRTHYAIALCLVAGLVLLVPALADGPAKPKPKNPQLGKLRHVVLFQFKEGTTPEDVAKIETAFRALPSKIPQIVGFEWGKNNSPEGLAGGLTHCFLLTFDDAKGRDVYLPHPAHKEFGALLRPHLEKAVVVDYFAAE